VRIEGLNLVGSAGRIGPNGATSVEMRPTTNERAYMSLMEPAGAQVPLLRPVGQLKLNSIWSFCPKWSTLDLKPTHSCLENPFLPYRALRY
jgi:hypothetical protein